MPVTLPSVKASTAAAALDLDRRQLVAVAGSGGKTSLILRLVGEIRSSGRTAAVTATTRMGRDEIPPDGDIVFLRGAGALRDAVEPCLVAGRVPFVFSAEGPDGKFEGVGQDTIDGLRELADVVLVEADGARGLPLKWPRPFEPVIPAGTDRAVIVLGAGPIGQVAGSHNVFNLGGYPGAPRAGDRLHAAAVARLIHAESGPLERGASAAQTHVFVNRADLQGKDVILDLASALGHPGVTSVTTGCAMGDEPVSVFRNRAHRVQAVVLAAGRSTRFGECKPAAPFRGEPLAARAVDAAREGGCDAVAVVVGDREADVRACLKGRGVDRWVAAPRYRDGMAASLKAGIAAVCQADAAMVLLADMPFVNAALVRRVLEMYREGTAPVCRPAAHGRPGHPVIFRRDLFPALGRITGDRGGRDVAAAQADRTAWVNLADGHTQLDIDDPKELERHDPDQ